MSSQFKTIIVTGGRDYVNRQLVETILKSFEPAHFVVGDCPTGVDKYVVDWTQSGHRSYVVYKAFWDIEGRAAGPKRNKRMIDAHLEALVIAFPGGRGTEDCVRQAKRAGLPVLRVETNERL